MHHFEMIKQKVYLLPEKLDQLSNLNISFGFLLLLLVGIYSSYLCIILISVAVVVLHYDQFIKFQVEHIVLYQLLQMLLLIWVSKKCYNTIWRPS